MSRQLLIVVALLLLGLNMTASAVANDAWVYVGTYTQGPAKQGAGQNYGQGIYAFRFDAGSGSCSDVELAAKTPNPSFLAVDPKQSWLYAVAENGSYLDKPQGGVCGFAIDRASGKLTPINRQNSGGLDPCHLAVDKTGRALLVANYSSGSVACLAIDGQGRLAPAKSIDQHHGGGADKSRQSGPHAHWIDVDPSNRFALSADLGNDRVYVYHLNAEHATLTPCSTPYATIAAGSGPRHLAFSVQPTGIVYVLNELKGTVTVMTFDDSTGQLSEKQTLSSLPPNFRGPNTAAEIQIHPSKQCLYTSNRGADNIAMFSIDAKSGALMLRRNAASGGKNPRGFVIDPSGRWMFVGNQDSDLIAIYSIGKTGLIEPTGKSIHVPKPVSIVFVK